MSYRVKHVDSLPVIDGLGEDEIWLKNQELVVQDIVANHNLYFSAVHNGEAIAIKIRFPDETENLEHKALLWDEASSSYQIGPKREDTMVLKWAMNSLYDDLKLNSNSSYQADIWYWKAFRTDPVGFADDKYQTYSRIPKNKSKRLRSKDGALFFLQRRGDSGSSTYKTNILIDKVAAEEPNFIHRQPDGSRADIKAKGKWQANEWTVEFMRKLDTGYKDDVSLVVGETALLGLSRYEIAGRKPNNTLEQPFFGSGEVGELIRLHLEMK